MRPSEDKSALFCSLINSGIILLLSVVSIAGLSTAPQFFGLGISMFVSIFTLIVTSFAVGIVASDSHRAVERMDIFKKILPSAEVRWSHVKYAVSLILGVFNLLSFLLLARMAQLIMFGGAYFVSCVSTLIIFLMFVFEAIVALRMVSDDSVFVAEEYQQISSF